MREGTNAEESRKRTYRKRRRRGKEGRCGDLV